MARQKAEVARVAISYTVLAETKETLKRLSSKERSAGEILDLAVGYWEAMIEVPETSRVVEAPMAAECLRCAEIQAALDKVLALGVPTVGESGPVALEQSAWVKSTLKRLGEEYSVSERDALDMVFAFFESMGGECPACSGRLAGIGEVQEGVVYAQSGDGTLVPAPLDGPEMACVHGGEVFRIPVGARFSDICPDCAGSGHVGDVRDCPVCGEGRSA